MTADDSPQRPTVEALAHKILEAAAELDAKDKQIAQLTGRAVAAEHYNMLERLAKGSVTEQLEMSLRTRLAEAELALVACQHERDLLKRSLAMLCKTEDQ
jgi:hypothetical protein